MLLRTWLDILNGWRPAFHQQRSLNRALRQALASLTTLGRRTLSRLIASQGRQQQDWSADYRLHARAPWQADDLFQPILEKALPLCRAVIWRWRWTTRASAKPDARSSPPSFSAIRCHPNSVST